MCLFCITGVQKRQAKHGNKIKHLLGSFGKDLDNKLAFPLEDICRVCMINLAAVCMHPIVVYLIHFERAFWYPCMLASKSNVPYGFLKLMLNFFPQNAFKLVGEARRFSDRETLIWRLIEFEFAHCVVKPSYGLKSTLQVFFLNFIFLSPHINKDGGLYEHD